jgi:hypothetical protein
LGRWALHLIFGPILKQEIGQFWRPKFLFLYFDVGIYICLQSYNIR